MSVDVTTIRPAVTDAALAGRRLDAGDVMALATATDILALGALADDVRRRRHGACVFVPAREDLVHFVQDER